jgi:hypothetical protein
MQNPMFFTENQRDIGNPHDALNDPYRSADIIISHVTGGDEMAKQYRLPARIRDFIREHHGTSEVYVFYKQAVILAGDDESLVDINDFTYPGPKPQSRETAVLMLADTCEAAVRSQQPETRQKIVEIVESVIDAKRKSGQLDESGLTLNDLKVIQNIYIDMLQAVFHPRINYAEAVARVRRGGDRALEKKSQTAVAIEPEVVDEKPTTQTRAAAVVNKRESDTIPVVRVETTPKVSKDQPAETPAVTSSDGDDDAPMPEVPRLRRTGESKSSRKNNVKANGDVTKSEETPESETEKTDE